MDVFIYLYQVRHASQRAPLVCMGDFVSSKFVFYSASLVACTRLPKSTTVTSLLLGQSYGIIRRI